MKNGASSAVNKWKKSGKLSSFAFQLAIYLVPLTLFVVFWFGTNVNSLAMAFQKIDFDGQRTPNGFANFKSFIDKLFNAEDNTLLQTSMVNSIKMFVINFIVSNPLYILFSFYLFKKLPGNRVMLILIMVPSIVSEFIISLIFKRFVNVVIPNVYGQIMNVSPDAFPKLLEDSRYSFATMLFFMIWVSFSTSLIVYPNAMRAISPEVIESAHIDGAGYWAEFWHIILPLIYPTFTTFAIIGVSSIFVNVGPAVAFYQFKGYPEVYTVGYYYTSMVMNATNETGYPELAAGGLLLTLVACPITYGTKYLLEKFTPETY